ncbi:YdcF family protein [Pseudoclavibacter terrae]|uniref:YdcF family protein n=1 Tax=Pseudoclavibacter terrae TaxID=1530195 RepID=UPI002330F492|nr:ElyC/SanA/YdcF family protein [Pseudoclavibacter terrae]
MNATKDNRPVGQQSVLSLMIIAVVMLMLAPVAPIFAPLRAAPVPADVILVLGPATDSRLDLAERLLNEGLSERLIVSAAHYGSGHTIPNIELCARPGDRRITCKQAVPFTTQGEVGMLEQQAGKNGWTSAIIITDTPHVTRARLYAERCFTGTTTVISDEARLDVIEAVDEYWYQTGAFAKAFLVTPGCA